MRTILVILYFLMTVYLFVYEVQSDINGSCPKSGTTCIKNETTVYVNPGLDVILNCTCANKTQGSWTGPIRPSLMDDGTDDQVPYSEGLDLNPKLNEAKFMVVGNYNTRVCNLKIKNFSKEEDGKYCCHHLVLAKVYINVYNVAVKRNYILKMSTINGAVVVEHTLYKSGTPSNLIITNEICNNAIYAQSGRQLTLVCMVQSGVPPEILKWSHKGNILESGGPGMINYTFIPSRKHNQQSFTCSATNNLLSSPLTREIYLNITYKPYIHISKSSQRFIEGKDGRICCIVESNPPALFTNWLNGNRTLQRRKGNKNCFSFSTLYRNDSGQYKCSSKNSVDMTCSSIELNIKYPPTVTVEYTFGFNYIEFKCNAAGEPNYYTFFQWVHKSEFHQQIRQFNGTTSGILRVYRTKNPFNQYEDSGYYMCRVSNGITNINGKTTQEGKTLVTFEGPPVFLLENLKEQYGTFGHETTVIIQLYSDTMLLSKNIRRNHAEQDLELFFHEKKVHGHVMCHGVKVMVSGTKLEFKIHMGTAEDFNSYTINICNRKYCNNMTFEVRSSDSPEPPENISVATNSQNLTVKWKPGFYGGFKQKFYIEYSTEKTNWKVAGPIDQTTRTIEKELTYTLTNLRPATQYFIRMFAKNKIGQSNKTNITTTYMAALPVAFENFSAVKPIVAIIAVVVLGSVVAFLVFRKQIGMCATRQDLSDTDFSHEETQDTSVENQLYQLAEPVELTNERGHGRAMFRPMQNNERNLVADSELQNSLDISGGNGRDLEEGEHVQIIESNLNYAEVMFSTKPKTNTIVVHGKEDKTIYSEIDHLKRAEALPSSSESESDSDDDFMYIDGIQIFTRKKTV